MSIAIKLVSYRTGRNGLMVRHKGLNLTEREAQGQATPISLASHLPDSRLDPLAQIVHFHYQDFHSPMD
ncbi:MAG: hypothetical protein EP321_00785 [Sphingomonadales bacterium]|nr:MAG: hypothetical protein EP345_17125 [Sphingomonadales bacterium]TNF06207.1 MAG: hypothetical protein EP321_00785 [Sphingomonadales bacterium]